MRGAGLGIREKWQDNPLRKWCEEGLVFIRQPDISCPFLFQIICIQEGRDEGGGAREG